MRNLYHYLQIDRLIDSLIFRVLSFNQTVNTIPCNIKFLFVRRSIGINVPPVHRDAIPMKVSLWNPRDSLSSNHPDNTYFITRRSKLIPTASCRNIGERLAEWQRKANNKYRYLRRVNRNIYILSLAWLNAPQRKIEHAAGPV